MLHLSADDGGGNAAVKGNLQRLCGNWAVGARRYIATDAVEHCVGGPGAQPKGGRACSRQGAPAHHYQHR